jgi:hypothetical protein
MGAPGIEPGKIPGAIGTQRDATSVVEAGVYPGPDVVARARQRAPHMAGLSTGRRSGILAYS